MKNFLIKTSYTILPLFIFFIGLTIYYNYYIHPNEKGDLGRLGKIPFEDYDVSDTSLDGNYNSNIFYSLSDLPYDDFDILLIGDSFVEQDGFAMNQYLGKKGLQCASIRTGRMYDVLWRLLDDSIYCKMNKNIVVESAERHVVDRILSLDTNNVYIVPYQKEKIQYEPLKEAKNYLLLRLGWEKPVVKFDLSKDLFSGQSSRSLYIYSEELTLRSELKEIEERDLFKNKLDAICDKAKQKKVNLIFMICVDKYDLYQNYIVDKNNLHKSINEDVKVAIGLDYSIIYTKDILLPLVESGEKDVYLLNDSHWSDKSISIVCDTLYRRIYGS